MEQATEVVVFRASPEVIAQLRDWSEPVNVRITPVGRTWEIEFRTPLALDLSETP